MIDRRDLLKSGAAILGVSALAGIAPARAASGDRLPVLIRREGPDSVKLRLAVSELRAGLLALGLAADVRETDHAGAHGQMPGQAHGQTILLRIDPRAPSGESYEIARERAVLVLRAAGDQALLYAVFDLLERQGMTYGLDGSVPPVESPRGWTLPAHGEIWRGQPGFAVRGLLPWPDFLNCISVYNKEDFRAYFAAMLRMRLNMFGMHVYTDNEQPTESYLSFEFAGAGQQATLETSVTRGWGYLPQRTSTYKMGAAQLFDRETFGSDAARLAADNWEIADRTSELLRDGLEFARELGIRTGIGFEPYKLPVAIADALPPEALTRPEGFSESPTARRLLERRLADLLERYPNVDYVWLWEDETSNWQSRARNVPISTTAFLQAHDFLRRHAPQKRLVVAGWGGFTRHFAQLHQGLPGDVIFSALGNTLGWDPVAAEFGALEARERWPIPWLEDDPSMWFPQFRAARIEADMKCARDFRCQGMLGIHWRQRIVDPTATYFARGAWESGLTAKAHYARYARSQASGPRAGELAQLLVDCDTGRAIVSTYTGKQDAAGFSGHIELSADYQEGFKYRENEPEAALLPVQRRTAERFAALAAAATTALERERLDYLSGFVGFMVPYCEAYRNAHALDAVLNRAVELRKAGDVSGARQLVSGEGVPLWTSLAPQVRQAMLQFQGIVATRNDLGQVASMQNKLVRIAIERLRLSLAEFVGDLPPEAQQVYETSIAPVENPVPRVFLPTRPSLLKPGEPLRLFIVTSGLRDDSAPRHEGGSAPAVLPGREGDSAPVLLTRRAGDSDWSRVRARHEGRGVFSVMLGPFDGGAATIQYRLEVQGPDGLLSDPPGDVVYWASLLT